MEARYINPHTDFGLFIDRERAYEDSNAINTAKKDSFAEGKAEGRVEIARIMRAFLTMISRNWDKVSLLRL